MTRESVARELNRGLDRDAIQYEARVVRGRCTISVYWPRKKQRLVITAAPSWSAALVRARQRIAE